MLELEKSTNGRVLLKVATCELIISEFVIGSGNTRDTSQSVGGDAAKRTLTSPYYRSSGEIVEEKVATQKE